MTTTYPPAVQALLAGDRLPSLGRGEPNLPLRPVLQSLTVEQICEPAKVVRLDMARACLAGLWLHHDFLDESHAISQEIDTAEGSFWHAIMHRREPDAWNSKYWFRKVGSHRVIDRLVDEAPSLGYEYTNPNDFVDFCERVRGCDSADEIVARRVQLLEYKLLFSWCFLHAAGQAR
jgi:hypothetical protein